MGTGLAEPGRCTEYRLGLGAAPSAVYASALAQLQPVTT